MQVKTRSYSHEDMRGTDCHVRSGVLALCGCDARGSRKLRSLFPLHRRGALGSEGPASPSAGGILAPTRLTANIQNITSEPKKMSLDPGCPPYQLRHIL